MNRNNNLYNTLNRCIFPVGGYLFVDLRQGLRAETGLRRRPSKVVTEAGRGRLYWANAMFTDADRTFNERCVALLREAGYNVFLPQESAQNQETAPGADVIFCSDTTEVLKSDAVIACLDQETIDSGVACEVGLAYAAGIPIIGLYTDIRQHRHGAGRMYKNLYTIGAIEAFGRVVSAPEEILHVLPGLLKFPGVPAEAVRSHFDSIAAEYVGFITHLDEWYEPKWRLSSIVDFWLEATGSRRVLEWGCGPGGQGVRLCSLNANFEYIGYDTSDHMVQVARGLSPAGRCHFTASLEDVKAAKASFDMALVLFSLHEYVEVEETLSTISRALIPGGYILIVDIAAGDLPRLCRQLQIGLAKPLLVNDSRPSPTSLAQVADGLGLISVRCEWSSPAVRFPSAEDLDRYLDVFGIYCGMDLPLHIRPDEHPTMRARVRSLISTWDFPFVDRRGFITCVLRKDFDSRVG